MSSSDHRIRHDDLDRPRSQPYQGPSTAGPPLQHELPELTLLAAGCRGGKTSFLRLLLDTSVISTHATKDQLTSVAKFVQGSNGHTSFVRSASITINLDLDGNGQVQPLCLTLIDTPSLDFNDEPTSERHLADTLRHIDARLMEGLEDEWKAQNGNRFVHLCIYFLDPDKIIPPSVPAPPAPLISRTRTNSFSQPEHEPVILEPPVMNPMHARACLPQADIAAIRRLSSRVNVLPVIARADILSNDRLTAVKLAIRRDLAEAGIGFGIFDLEPQASQKFARGEEPGNRPDSSNGYGHGPNGALSVNNHNSPPTSPTTSPMPRLPYALISPDAYSHSDGVSRKLLSRHELVQQYYPSQHYVSPSQLPRGKFIRSYRWGALDVLDPSHSDFVPLRTAIFHHMETLQRYTRDHLFNRNFRGEFGHLQGPPRHSIQQQQQQQPPQLTHLPMPHSTSRPVLAIDTAHPTPSQRHHMPVQQQQPRHDLYPGDVRNAPPRQVQDPSSTGSSSRAAPSHRVKPPRSKKITVACNFCRSRKLKCDGGRPTCGQCLKRNNPCDYAPQNKRRGTQRPRDKDDSGSESGEERTPEQDEPSLSPELPSQTPSRRSSNVGRLPHDVYPPSSSSIPSVSAMSDRREESSVASSSRQKFDTLPSTMSSSSRGYYPDNDVPHIATLPPVDTAPPTPAPMSAPNLPPIRPASDLQAAQRKRAATVPGKINRGSISSGPKVVACNFCRARKTKCDGAQPACASCARRQLDCNYVHDSSGSNGSGAKRGRRPSTSKPLTADSARSVSPPSSRMIPTPSTGEAHDLRDIDMRIGDGDELKRPLEYAESHRAPKKMRMDDNHPSHAGIP
ncbi:hypothetical protein CPC08DRAFT_704439 [Agrocybe pediades]|nr:hypothetical protein CPC08DRAFT_704439 [Agrocybe pediades]